MKMSEDERQCLSESRGGSANVISIFSYCARRYCQNQLKLCKLKVQADVQLAISKFCSTVKDCRSQAPFKDFIIQGMGPKVLS